MQLTCMKAHHPKNKQTNDFLPGRAQSKRLGGEDKKPSMRAHRSDQTLDQSTTALANPFDSHGPYMVREE